MWLLSMLVAAYKSHNRYGQYRFKYVGVVGLLGYPIFGLIYYYALPQEYVGIDVRVMATFLCLVLALKDYWPKLLQPYYLGYAYFTVLFILPFFHTVMVLHNSDNSQFIHDSLMALFFAIMITDWRNMLVMYCIGTIGGALHYLALTPDATLITTIAQLGTLPIQTAILIIIGGYFFKHSLEEAIGQEKQETMGVGGSIAHEMRNPLNSLKLTLQNIEQDIKHTENHDHLLSNRTKDSIHESINMGFNSIKRALNIIEITLKNLIGEEIDKSTFVWLSVGECIKENLKSYGYQAGEQTKISAEINDDFTFKGDPNLFACIVFNLMKNAFYYLSSFPHSRVSIKTKKGDDAYNYLYFRDTGPGIPAKKLPQLFGNFVSFGKKSGTGLGLSFCKRAMLAFGGDITCESVEGEYTEFILKFPKTNAKEAQNIQHFDKTCPLEGHRILIVDDSRPDLLTTKAHFSNTQVEVDEAASGDTAIALMKTNRYDLVLMDIEMPGMNGMETTTKIRQGGCFENGESPNHTVVPIIAHSSACPKTMTPAALQSGMNDFVIKPAQSSILLNRVLGWLSLPSEEALTNLLQGKRILIVDDQETNRRLAAKLLTQYGMEIGQAVSGKDALNALELDHYALILMDINMPEMDGLQATKIIRKTKSCNELPIIALAGDADITSTQKALQAGMNDYLTKPVERKKLLFKLYQWLIRDRSFQDTNVYKNSNHAHHLIKPKDAMEILSQEKIEELMSYFGTSDNDNDFENLIDCFLQETEESIASLKLSFENNNVESFAAISHKIKGAVGNIGAEKLFKLVKQLNDDARHGKLPSLDSWFADLEATFQQTKEALSQLMTEKGAYHQCNSIKAVNKCTSI